MPRTRSVEPSASHLARKAEILRASARLIHQKGFAGTRIDDIAAAVHLTKAGLYHYIPKKSHLLVAIMSYALDRLDGEVLAPCLEESNAERRLRTMISQLARLAIEEKDCIPILTDEMSGLKPEERRRVASRMRRFLRLLRATLKELRSAGVLRGVKPNIASFNLLGAVLWLPRWYEPGRRHEGAEVIAETTDFILAGLLETR